MKIYVASSWRNSLQPWVVTLLREQGHEVYDFRNPPGGSGFSWREIDPAWECWSPQKFRDALEHPVAIDGFSTDMNALLDADCCVLVMPCGRSAFLELGFAVGDGQETIVYWPEQAEPELMVKMADRIATSVEELLAVVAEASTRVAARADIHKGGAQ